MPLTPVVLITQTTPKIQVATVLARPAKVGPAEQLMLDTIQEVIVVLLAVALETAKVAQPFVATILQETAIVQLARHV